MSGDKHPMLMKPEEMASWDEYVLNNPYAIAWQLSSWSGLVEKHFGSRFYPIAVKRNGAVAGVLPLYWIKPLVGGGRMISVPHAVAGGILADDPEARRELLEEGIQTASREGIGGITLKQYKIRVEGELTTDDQFFNRELDLTGGSEELWSRISEHNREQVERTDSQALTLVHPLQDQRKFYRFLVRFQKRRGVPCVSEKWVRDLVDLGLYSIAALVGNGRIVAATMVKEFKKTVSFPFTCSMAVDDVSYNLVYRLYWELMKKYSEQGFEICHSGRIPVTEQVESYRLGWGGERYPYFYQHYPKTAGQPTEFQRKRNWKRDLVSKGWKYLPSPIARFAGPVVVRQFP